MGSLVISQAKKLAETFGMGGDERELVDVLKATAFKGPVSDSQMTALLIVAGQYGLNPFTKEVYAFPDRNNGIVPVVGVDGWSRIINSHEMFDGMSFEQDDESCTCTIYRKDRSHPIQVTEYMSECRRDVGPWKSHPKRMLRHKTMIQCARLAFGFVGVYDQDEAERIVERDMGTAERVTESFRHALEVYPEERFRANLSKWRDSIESGRKTPEDIIAIVSSGFVLTEEQKAAIRTNHETGDISQ